MAAEPNSRAARSNVDDDPSGSEFDVAQGESPAGSEADGREADAHEAEGENPGEFDLPGHDSRASAERDEESDRRRQAGQDPDVDASDPAVLQEVYGRLAEGAVRALSIANLLRLLAQDDTIHVDHLIYALFRTNPPARLAITDHLDESGLLRLLEGLPRERISDDQLNAASPLTTLPPLSGHVRVAILRARVAAAGRGVTTIVGEDLFVALMSLPQCTAVVQLREQGVTGEIRLDARAFRVYSAAKADQPTKLDLIGHGKIADALVELLTGDSTTFPLTIAVAAPWGGGKSSLMAMLETRLTAAGGPRWLNVRFPAWRYETGEQVWAAMAKATYDAALDRRNVLAAWWFRLRLEMRRGGRIRGLLRPVVTALGAAAGALVGAFVGPALTGATGESGAAAGGVGAAAGGVGALAVVVQGLWGAIGDPFKNAVESFAENPRVEEGDGFTAAAARQVDALMRELLAGGGRVAIFIDDLDRCTPRNLVRVVEAVNQIFIAGSDLAENARDDRRSLIRRLRRQPAPPPPRLVFILGMDRRVVARGIETEYGALMERMKEAEDDARTDFGLAFLDKIVQLWVTLPRPTAPEKVALLASVNNRIEVRGTAADQAAVEAQKRRLEAALAQVEGPQTRSARIAVVKALTRTADPDQTGALQEASQEFLAQAAAPDATDSDQVWDALLVGLKVLDANPRQIKRYNNAFRLQLNVAARSERVTFSQDQLNALARYVAIRLRWPNVASWLDDDLTRLAQLEVLAVSAAAAGKAASAPSVDGPTWAADGLESKAVADPDDLLAMVRPVEGGLPISMLPFEDFLAIA